MGEFDFNQKFPISDYINGVIEKRKIEQQNEQIGRESIIRGLASIGGAVDQYSKTRAQNESDLARAAILSKTSPEAMSAFDSQVGTRSGADGQQIPIQASETPDGRQQIIQAMARSLRGVSGDAFLDKATPVLDIKTPFNVATGETLPPIVSRVPKGSKSAFIPFGTRPLNPGSGMADDRNRQLAAAKVKERSQTDLNELMGTKNLIDDLEKKYESASKSAIAGKGIISRMGNAVNNMTGGALNEDVLLYNDARKGFVSKLRQVSEEKGVLSDQDRAALLDILGTIEQGKDISRDKFSTVRAIMGRAIERKKSLGNTLIQEIQSGNPITGLTDGGTGDFDPSTY